MTVAELVFIALCGAATLQSVILTAVVFRVTTSPAQRYRKDGPPWLTA